MFNLHPKKVGKDQEGNHRKLVKDVVASALQSAAIEHQA